MTSQILFQMDTGLGILWAKCKKGQKQTEVKLPFFNNKSSKNTHYSSFG